MRAPQKTSRRWPAIRARAGLAGALLGACLSLPGGPAAAEDPPAKPTADPAAPAAAPGQTPTPTTQAQKKRPELRVVEAVGAEGVKLSEPFAEVSHTFTIESLDKQGVTELAVRVDPLVDSAGTPHDVTWTLDSKPWSTRLPVKAFGSIPLQITANLPATGVYTGQIFLAHDDGRDPIKLTITRGLRAPSVEIVTLDPVRETASVVGTNSVDVWLTLHETSGHKVELPTVEMLGWTSKDGKNPARYGSPLTLTVDGLDPQTKALVLTPNQTRRVKLKLDKLAGAGEYTGTLRVAEAGAQSVDKALTLYLHDPEWWAALLIFLGTLVSFATRRWGQDIRPRLLLQQEAALVLEELSEQGRSLGPLSDEEARLLGVIRGQITAFRARLQVELPRDADAKVAILDGKQALFGSFLQARRKVASLMPPELRAQFQPTLTTAESDLVSPTATAESLTADAKALVDMVTTAIPGAVRDVLQKGIDELDHEIQRIQSDGSSSVTSRIASDVTPSLDRAKKKVTEGNASLNDAVLEYTVARRGYLGLLIDDLSRIVSRSALPAQALDGIHGTLGAARDALGEHTARSAASYESAFYAYLEASKEQMAEKVSAMSAKLDGKDATPEEKQALADLDMETEIKPAKQALQEIQTRLEGVAQKIQARDLSGASGDFKRAGELLGKVRVGIFTRSRAPGAPGVTGTLIAASGAVPSAVRGAAMTMMAATRMLDGSRSVKSRIDAVDLVIEITAAAATTVGGTVVLFADNPTWGGWASWGTAFLLGIGVQQVTGAGLSQIADKIRGKKETS